MRLLKAINKLEKVKLVLTELAESNSDDDDFLPHGSNNDLHMVIEKIMEMRVEWVDYLKFINDNPNLDG